MNLQNIAYIILLYCSLHGKILLSSAVTVTPGGGRFGDQLVKLFNAMYVAHHYHLPLIYRPFEFSDQLKINILYDVYYDGIEKKYDKVVEIFNDYDFKIDPNKNILYLVGIRFKPKNILKNKEDFIARYRAAVTPINQPSLLQLSSEYINVAVHVRRGTGFDRPVNSNTVCDADRKWPLKFPPESFYIDELQRISDFFPNNDIYCYIFSDDENVLVIKKRIEASVNRNNCIFDSRDLFDYKHATVIDFFNMMQFDCLIRPQSSYSKMIEKLGNFSIVISPADFYWYDEELFIAKSKIVFKNIKKISC